MTNVEEQLRDSMRSSVADIRLSDDVLAAAVRGNRRRTKIRCVAAAATAVASIALAGTLVATTPPAPASEQADKPPASITHRPSPAFDARSVALITQRIVTAPSPTDAIVHTVHTSRAGADGYAYARRDENWDDLRTSRGTAFSHLRNGRLESGTEYPFGGAGGKVIEVDYTKRTYSVRYQRAEKLWWTHPYGKAGEPLIDDVKGIKAAVKRSDVSIIGKGRYAGRPAVHLRFNYKTKDVPIIRGDVWFDAETYAPLRAQADYGELVTVTRYLPRTKQNVSRTRLTLDKDFRRVAPPSK